MEHATRIVLAILVFFAFTISTQAATIHVPADQPTIQAGINTSVDGDEVLVAPGTYVENITFLGKAITVQSEDGAEQTIIDGNHAGSVVTFDSGETPAAILDGFTLRNGYSTGGGIYCISSSPTIENCTVTGNTGTPVHGGGIYCAFSLLTISNCSIIGNSSLMFGGGITIWSSDPTIENCSISGNSAFAVGGGIFHYQQYGSSTEITNCLISGNQAVSAGGVYCQTIFSSWITNCTIAGNSASGDGGGFSCYGSTPTIVNCILWGDTSPTGPEIALYDGSTLTVSYSDVQGGETAAYVAPGCTLDWSSGNMNANPLFVSRADYQLADGSPCIDTGNPTSSYNDACFPPSKGTALNDMGGFGGPGACAGLGPGAPAPTLIELTSFDAVSQGSKVLVRWKTASEIDNEGFHLWRAEEGEGGFTRITSRMIPSEGGPLWGAHYDHIDEDVTIGQTYFYKLEAIDIYGASALYGPVEVMVGGPGCFIDVVM